MKTYDEELNELENERHESMYMRSRNDRYNDSYIHHRLEMIDDRIDRIRELRRTDHERDYHITINRKFEEEAKKVKEIESNIPKRALMLETFSDSELPHLPHLTSGLWSIIAQYEGGVESSLLGNNDSNVQNTSGVGTWWCSIL